MPMRKPAHIVEIILHPGDFYFGDRDTRIRTLLGSCVSITIWHPQLLIGGMCHYVLPSRGGRAEDAPDGRYGDEAMEMFMKEVRGAGTRAGEYEVKLFGGSNMFPFVRQYVPCLERNCIDPIHCDCRDVSRRNKHAARKLVERHGFSVKAEHLGGTCPRNLFFDIWSGYAWVKRNQAGKDCAATKGVNT